MISDGHRGRWGGGSYGGVGELRKNDATVDGVWRESQAGANARLYKGEASLDGRLLARRCQAVAG
jgi:hypothetical protein